VTGSTPDIDRSSRLLWWHPQDVLRTHRADRVAVLLSTWGLICALSVASGLLSCTWTGITFRFGLLSIGLTFYPPLTLCLLLTFWVGPVWGIVPAILTSFIISLHHGS
jgi:hypothetical protein